MIFLQQSTEWYTSQIWSFVIQVIFKMNVNQNQNVSNSISFHLDIHWGKLLFKYIYRSWVSGQPLFLHTNINLQVIFDCSFCTVTDVTYRCNNDVLIWGVKTSVLRVTCECDFRSLAGLQSPSLGFKSPKYIFILKAFLKATRFNHGNAF